MFGNSIKFDDGSKVISIEVARQTVEKNRRARQCPHMNVVVDTLRDKIECKDCNQDLSASQWIAMMVDHWSLIQRETDMLKRYREEHELRESCKCEHCGKMTKTSFRKKSLKEIYSVK